jgi:SAM-dependent methyltransferase
VTYAADLATGGDLPRERFDCAIVTQTLQFVFDPPAAVRSLHRALRPGGAVIATLPGVTRMSETDPSKTWYWAFAPAAALRLFTEVFGAANTVVQWYGNVLAATAFLYGLAASELTDEELAHRDPSFPVIIGIRAVKA